MILAVRNCHYHRASQKIPWAQIWHPHRGSQRGDVISLTYISDKPQIRNVEPAHLTTHPEFLLPHFAAHWGS